MGLSTELNNAKVIDFGEVEIGKTVVKSFDIVNESCKDLVYEAQRDPTTNPLDYVFNLKSYNWTLRPDQTFSCEVLYQPIVTGSKNVDYFIISNTSRTCIKIITRGSCIGPGVSVSTNKVILVCQLKKTEVKKQIKLLNNSKIKAKFMFDFDTQQAPFKMDPMQGIIEPFNYKYVTITFIPPTKNIYVYRLPCLVLYQGPIIIDLYGFYGVDHSGIDLTSDNNKQSPNSKNCFKEYMSDSTDIENRCPSLMSLSNKYLDCGQMNVEDTQNTPRQTVCFTNHSNKSVLLRWEKDFTGLFDMVPSIAKISPNNSALFEITFNPNIKDSVYMREFVGYISSESDQLEQQFTKIPMITSIRIIGHSFPPNSNGWIPQHDIPQTITLPPCIPPYPVYITFSIKKFGHLPLMFQFMSPPESHFAVKPILGVIYGDYQIITVQMFPEPEGEHVYVEQWAICFNGSAQNKTYINFRGYAEYANVSFNNKSVVSFNTVHPGCQQRELLLMRNITRHVIEYRYINLPPELSVRYSKNIINSNEILSQEFIFYPTRDGEYSFEIKCILMIISDGNSVGNEVVKIVHVCGKCEAGALVALPNELNFDIVAYGDTKAISFNIFNFSSVSLPFQMVCHHYNWPIGNIEKDVKIQPIAETIFIGKSEKITVSITPHTPGFYELTIKYLLRVSSQSEKINTMQPAESICKLYCMCVLPTLQINDLHVYGNCPLMSKNSLYEMMGINCINTILDCMQPNEKKAHNMRIHPMIMQNKPICITLYIINPTPISISWNFKRVKLCSCQLQTKTRGFSFRYKQFECIHRKICSIEPQSGILKPKKTIPIKMKVYYTILGKTQIRWDLNIDFGRHIFLTIEIESLSGTENTLHLLNGSVLHVNNVQYNDKHPLHQVCWIYNSTNHCLPYSVNTAILHEVNEAYHSEIFSCLDPHGSVEAHCMKPLILKFQPRQFETFKTNLPITLGENETELMLVGDSSLKNLATITKQTVASNYVLKIQEYPVYFINNRVTIVTTVHRRTVTMLTMYNTSSSDRFSYQWKSQTIPDLLHIKVHPANGLLQPETIQSFRVILVTNGCPCEIDINLSCEFVNASQRRNYQRSVFKYDTQCSRLEGEFTITEKGITVPEKPKSILENEPEMCYKVLSVHCTIYDLEDYSSKVKLTDELKCVPMDQAFVEKKKETKKQRKELSMLLFILEGMIWEIINSKSFHSIINEIATTKPHLHYSQFVMNLTKRKKLTKKSYIATPRKLISLILEKILFIMIHEEFQLDTEHLFHERDIRHLHYTKSLTRALPIVSIEDDDQWENEVHLQEISNYPTLRVSFSD